MEDVEQSDYFSKISNREVDSIKLSQDIWVQTFGEYSHYSGVRALGVQIYENNNEIIYFQTMDMNLGVSISYSHLNNKAMKSLLSIHESHSITAHSVSLALGYDIFYSDKLGFALGLGSSYLLTTWKNVEFNTSGKFNKFMPSVTLSMVIAPFSFNYPTPTVVGFWVVMKGLYHPTIYNIDVEGQTTLDNWQLTYQPSIGLVFHFPLRP